MAGGITDAAGLIEYSDNGHFRLAPENIDGAPGELAVLDDPESIAARPTALCLSLGGLSNMCQ